MANNYTSIPNIVPGNLTVQGNLDVVGPQIRLGRYASRYRIQEMGNGQFTETVNLDGIAVTQDDLTRPSQTRWIFPAGPQFQLTTQPPGAPHGDVLLLTTQPGEFVVAVPSFRVGSAYPVVRLYNFAGTGGYYSVNLQSDGTTRDDPTTVGHVIGYNVASRNLTSTVVDTAGNRYSADPPRCFWYDHTGHGISGVTGIQTIGTKTIYGNQLGANGAILLRVCGNANTSATGTIQVGINWGGTAQPLLTMPSSLSTTWWTNLVIGNNNVTGTQILVWFGGWGGSSGQNSIVQTTKDTTANQTLTITANPSDTGTTLTVWSIEAEFICRATAI